MSRLAELRKAAGLTQAGLAFFATRNGAGNTTVSKWEGGKIRADRPTVALYLLLSMMTPDELEAARVELASLLELEVQRD